MSDQNYVLAFSKFRYVWEETELKIPTSFESKEHRKIIWCLFRQGREWGG